MWKWYSQHNSTKLGQSNCWLSPNPLVKRTDPSPEQTLRCGTVPQNNRTFKDQSRAVIGSTLHSLTAEKCVICLGADMKDLPLYFIQSKSMQPQNDWKPITAASVSERKWSKIFLEFEMWVSSLSVTSTHTLPLYYTYITPQSCIWQKSQSPWQPNSLLHRGIMLHGSLQLQQHWCWTRDTHPKEANSIPHLSWQWSFISIHRQR